MTTPRTPSDDLDELKQAMLALGQATTHGPGGRLVPESVELIISKQFAWIPTWFDNREETWAELERRTVYERSLRVRAQRLPIRTRRFVWSVRERLARWLYPQAFRDDED